MSENSYLTLGGEGSGIYTEKKSEFIGYAAHVETEEEAIEFIARIRHKHGDARHNVYAYLLRSGAARYSDDGEPQGTAGVPVLETIKKGGFSDAVIVVTRYFGGILLGAGGLVRAYTAAAKAACDDARVVCLEELVEIRVECSYNEYQRLLPHIKRCELVTDDTVFTDVVTLSLAGRESDTSAFAEALGELSGGKLSPAVVGKRFGVR